MEMMRLRLGYLRHKVGLLCGLFCFVLGHVSLQAQTYDSSVFVVDKTQTPSLVMQAWADTPVQFQIQDQFFSSFLNRYLGQNGQEVFAATANLLSSGNIVYQEPMVATFNESGFSITLGRSGNLYPSTLRYPNLVLQLRLPSEVATFAMTSLPYVLHARVADRGLSGSASLVSGNFVSTFSVQSGVMVSGNAWVVRGSRVGIGTSAPAYPLDVAGLANFSELYVAGTPLRETLSWRSSTVRPGSIFTTRPSVSVGGFPDKKFAMHVIGTVNATAFTRNGNPLSASNYWIKTTNPTYNLYIMDSKVALGRSVPLETLDINGGLLLDTTSSANPGTIRWAAVGSVKDFQGYIQTMEGSVPTQTWRSLTGLSGSGRANRVTQWTNSTTFSSLGSVNDLVHTQGVGLGIGVSPTSVLQVRGRSQDTVPVFLVTSTANAPLLQVSPTGSVGIGTTLTGEVLEVSGTLNATDLLIGGEPIRLKLSKGTYWLRNRDNNSIYYLHGFVGIGRPDPTSLLEIAAPNKGSDEVTKNPAITFTAFSGLSNQQQYTLGVNAANDGVFRVEKGAALGVQTPLFVAFEDRFGIGLESPKANLHVSGNTGLIVTGLYQMKSDPSGLRAIMDTTATVSVTGAGTRLIYHPARGAFRAGHLTGLGVASGAEWDDVNLGADSTVFGRDSLVSGNRSSHALGGDNHAIGAGYAAVLGGQGNRVYGDFSVAMGRNAEAMRHGNFVWADSSAGVFSSVAENQFLIRATGGVGINTSQTGLSIAFTTRNVGLSVASLPVGAVHFLGILPSPTDWASAQSIVDALKTQGYLSSTGVLVSSFDGNAVLTLPPGFPYASLEPQIRSVLAMHAQKRVLNLVGATGSQFVYTQQHGVGIQTDTPTANTLSVMGRVLVNGTGNAQMFVQSNSVSSVPLLLTVGTQDARVSPSFVAVSSGNVGIGKYPDLLVNGVSVSTNAAPLYGFLDVAGTVIAEAFVFPDGQGLSASESVLVWAYAATTPNIYFPSANVDASGRIMAPGKVGIGTTSPNSLLEISNRSSMQSLLGVVYSPVITLDLDGVDRYTFGVPKNEPSVFRIGPGGASDLGVGSPLSVSGSAVGIAMTAPLNNRALSVGGSARVNRVRIGTANMTATTNFAVRSLNATKFLVNNEIVDWLSVPNGTRTDVFYDTSYDVEAVPPVYSYVGVGTSQPRYALDIVGTLNVRASNNLPALSVQDFTVDGDFYGSRLYFRDTNGSVSYLRVSDGDLQLVTPNGGVLDISDVFTRGEGPGGYIGMWSTDPNVPSFSVIARSNIYWTSPTETSAGVMLVTSDARVSQYVRYSDSFTASTNLNLSDLTGVASGVSGVTLSMGVKVRSDISREGDLPHTNSHRASDVSMIIKDWPGDGDWVNGIPSYPIVMKGVNVTLQSQLNPQNVLSRFSTGAKAIGIQSDVTQVNLQQFTDVGYKYPAIFMGHVGVGATPNVTLDVRGSLSAQAFHISNGLSISTINVENSVYVTSPGRVGFGTSSPSQALDLAGSISAIGMHAPVVAPTLASSGTFNVASNGFVGMGLTNPSAQWELQRSFFKPVNSDFTFQLLDLTIQDSSVDTDAYGVLLRLASATPYNYLGHIGGASSYTATGYKIDLTGLDVPPTGQVVGVSSIVSANLIPERKAARFLGGNVGIGTSTPAYPLEVNGTIFATNVPAASFLTEQEVASFSVLQVANNLRIKQTAVFQNAQVNTLKQTNLQVRDTLSIPSQDLIVAGQTVVNGFVSTNAGVTVNSLFLSKAAALYSVSANTLAIGGGLVDSALLRVYGGMSALSGMRLADGTLSAGALSVNTASLTVSSTGRLGIGTAVPSAGVHVVTLPYTQNAVVRTAVASDYRTWNPIVIQGTAASMGQAVGIALVPEFDSSGQGSGILAIKTSDTESASALAFVTDPEGDGAYPQERLRITDSGWVGVGTSQPTAMLHVNGSMVATTASIPVLSVNNISGTTVTVSVTMNVVSLVSANRVAASRYSLLPGTVPAITSDNGKLFVDQTTNQLFYGVQKNGDLVLGNLSVTSSVLPNTVAYFNQNRSLDGDAYFTWSTKNIGGVSQGVLQIASNNPVAYPTGSRVLQVGYVATDQATSATLSAVRLGFTARTSPGTAQFVGQRVVLDAGQTHLQDVYRGLHVDVAPTLKTTTTLPNGTVVSGSVVAAVFLVGSETSGNVGISSGSDSEVIPSASLHVLGKYTNHAPLWIQTATNTALLVSANTFVGMGTSLPTAKLTIGGQAGTDKALHVVDAAGTSRMSVTEQGVGIGYLQPTTALAVAGTMTGVTGVFGGVSVNTLAVNTGNTGMSVSELGEVMMGTTSPLGQFTLKKQFTNATQIQENFPLQRISQTLFTPLNKPITGVALRVSTDANAVFEGATGSKLARGMVLNLSRLVSATGNPVVGAFVDMGAQGPNKYAAVFRGGHVGIGDSAPTVALSVAGDIRARDLSASGNWSLAAVTTNYIYAGDAQMVSLNIQTASPISLEVLGMLGIDGAATVNIEGVQDANQFAAMMLLSTVATANKVYVGMDTGFLSNTVLGVQGNGLVESLSVSTVNVGAISGSTIGILGNLNVTANKITHAGDVVFRRLLLKPAPTADPSTYTPYATVYVPAATSQSDRALVFRNPTTGVTANLTTVARGDVSRLAGYDQNQRISDQPFVRYRDYQSAGVTYSIVSVGTANATLSSGNSIVDLVLGYGQVTGLSTVTASRVLVGMKPRTVPGTSIFSGASVEMAGTFGSSVGDRVGGLFVDMGDSLLATTSFPGGGGATGTKIAAVFRTGAWSSGNVGIQTDELATSLLRPSANLHILSASTPPLLIQTTAVTALGSDVAGNLSFGSAVPSAKLSVSGYADRAAFEALAGNTAVLRIGEAGVGIGQSPMGLPLSVSGVVSANSLSVGGVSANSIQWTSGVAITTGALGIGTTTPESPLHVVKRFPTPVALTDRYVQRAVSVNLQNAGTVYSPLVGYQLVVTADKNSQFGTGIAPADAKGLLIDMTGLAAAGDATVYGVRVTHGQSDLGTSHNTMALLGGNVGIGTTTPLATLDVAGEIRGRDLIAGYVSVNATSVTANTLAITGGGRMQTLSITAPGTDLVVTDTLRFAQTTGVTLNFQNSLSERRVWQSDTVVADVATFNLVYVPQWGAGALNRQLWVSENALMRHNLTLSPYMNTVFYTGGLLSTGSIQLPSLRIANNNALFVTGNLTVQKTMYLEGIGSGLVLSDQNLSALVLVNDAINTELLVPSYRYKNGSVDRNISLLSLLMPYSGTPTTFNMALYGSDSILTKNVALFLRPDTATGNHIHVVSNMGTDSFFAVGVTASIGTSTVASDYSANKVNLTFGDRTGGGVRTFVGTDLLLSGRVPQGEVAAGVRVDLRQLLSESSTLLPIEEDRAIDGRKAAAVFLAGNNGDTRGTVGAFTLAQDTDTATPDATFHVRDRRSGTQAFIIGTVGTANTVVVTSRNVGVWTTSQDAQLRTTKFLVHATESDVMSVANAVGTRIVHMLDTRGVGIGTTMPVASLNVVHDATTGYAFWAENSATFNPFVITGAGNVGLGTTTPTALVDLNFNAALLTLPVSIEWRLVAEIPSVGCNAGNVLYQLTGTYLLNGVSYTYASNKQTVNCYSDSKNIGDIVDVTNFSGESGFAQTVNGGYSPFLVQVPGIPSVFSMSAVGKVGVWGYAPVLPYVSLSVSGSVMAGDDTSWSGPAWLDAPSSGYPIAYGYTTRQSGDFAFFGHYQSSPGLRESVVLFGKDSTDILSVRDVTNTELLRFQKTRMGVVTSDPKATLSVGATAVTQYPFWVSPPNASTAFVVDTVGNVGLGTSAPSVNLHVIGNVGIRPVVGGTLFAGTVSSNHMALENLDLAVSFVPNASNTDLVSFHNVGMTLSRYVTQNITGIHYRLASGNAYGVVDNTQSVKVQGLRVDVSNLFTDEYTTNTSGYKAAAAFMGGSVLIGHRVIGGVKQIPTSNIPLQAYAMDADGAPVSAGVLFRADTYKNGVFGRRVLLTYEGEKTLNHEVSPLAFTPIQTIDDSASAALSTQLFGGNALVVSASVGAAYVPPTTLVAVTASPYTSIDASYRQSVYDIVSQAKTKASVVFGIQRGGTNQDSMIQMLSGQDASAVTASMVSEVGVGYVGIGLSSANADLIALDKALVVSGDVQIGVTSNSFFTSAAGWGSTLSFSGGRIYAPGGNSDNTHAYFMGRYNLTGSVSELRLNIGETATTSPNPSSKLIIDSTPVAGAIPQNLIDWGSESLLATGFSVSVFGYKDPADTTLRTELPVHAGVGIGTTSPATGLHVVGRKSPGFAAGTPYAHTMLVESRASSQNLAIVNYGTGTDANFMTFIHKDTDTLSSPTFKPTVLGAIEMDGFGGVQFASPEADYAEYLPKQSKSDTLRPGDVVGVFNGEISRKTSGARSVRVISSRPIVSGNFPGKQHLSDFGLVAFMGQVSVRVRGPVRAGDYLIPSGRQDGTAIAVPMSDLVQPELIIGQAWESSSKEGETLINTLVGMSFANRHVGEQLGQVVSLREDLEALIREKERLEAYLQTRYEERQAKIALLKRRLGR